MSKIMRKELCLSASPLAFLFISFGLLFFVPGYPILCGAFFVTLGLFHSFQAAREANDITFSALLPIGKRDVVKGKYLFVCFIEACGFVLMALCTIIRMTVLSDAPVYQTNALMAANPFALAMALFIFSLFNWVFVGGFFQTGWKQGRPFVVYCVLCFLTIAVAEALHHIPGLAVLNAFGFEHLALQLLLLAAGILASGFITSLACQKACRDFEKIDL